MNIGKLVLEYSVGDNTETSHETTSIAIAKLVLEYIQVLIWPIAAITALLILKKPLVAILNRVRKAELPGGVSIDLEEKIATAQELADKAQASSHHKHAPATLPLTEANTRMVTLGLQPSPSGLDLKHYHEIAAINPNLALAGLRMEIEIIARNLIKGFKLNTESKEPVRRTLDRLLAAEAITIEQYEFLIQIIAICNDAIHLQSVSRDRAISVIDLTESLLEDYLSWLQWGFPDR